MLGRITRWSLENRVVTLFAASLLLVSGVYVATTMPVDVFPDLTAPTVTVLTDAHGMAPEEVESLVTFPIETAVNGSAGVRRVRSSSAQGISIVWVEFDWGTDIYRARQIVGEKLQTVSGALPQGADPPVLAPIASVMGEILLIGMRSDRHDPREVREAADWTVRRRLLAIPGVAQVIPIGGAVRQYQIRVRPAALEAYDIGLDEVLTAAGEASGVASGGVYHEGGREVLSRAFGRAHEVGEIARTVVGLRGGAPVLLSDVATVEEGPGPRFGTASVDAEPAVVLSIQKQPEVNTLDLTGRILREIAEIETQLPEGMEIETGIFRQADFISGAIYNVEEALVVGAVLVVVILFLFLWNVRTTAISVLAIPLSLALAMLVLRLLGGTLNTMTLGGLAIAIGALVDDAIITVENTFRRLRERLRRPAEDRGPVVQTVYEAAREVLAPIVSATLIIAIVFVP
ncbi:MAG TPA: efflux RND transporter permease subunit, partial [Gemmatimonadota bacterium]|nr:efflux RND transporter permease subunit [Gemmatimonadota bacterium]